VRIETSRRAGGWDVARAALGRCGGRIVPRGARAWLWFPLAIYTLTRLVTFVVVSIQQRDQIALPFTNPIIRIPFPQPESPGYLDAMTNWDGQWYELIATSGYPHELPRAWDGTVDMNPWAFYPVFPMSSRGIMSVTGLPFDVVGPLWAMVVGALAVVLLFRLVDEAVGRWEACVVVVATSSYVAAPIFQAAYTESFALLIVVLVMMALRARRYAWAAVALVALALTRNIVIAMAPVVLAHGIVAYRDRFRIRFPRGRQIVVAGLALLAVALTWLWPLIVGASTGIPDAYNQTMAAWRIQATQIKIAFWWNFLYVNYGLLGQALGAAFVIFFAWFMVTPRAWRWGPEIWAWAGAYPAYIVLVTTTGPSRLRYLLLAWPFALLIAWALDRAWLRRWRWWLLIGVALVGMAQQAFYTGNYLLITHLDGVVYYP
jgi:hypothetical protein